MVDLGTKVKNNANTMYPHSVPEEGEEKIEHMPVRLPLKLLGDMKFKKGDRICIKLEGEITGIHDDEYSSDFQMKAEEGECLEQEENDDEESGTYLGKDSEKE